MEDITRIKISQIQKNALKNGLNLIISLYINAKIYRGINIEILYGRWKSEEVKESKGLRVEEGEKTYYGLRKKNALLITYNPLEGLCKEKNE